MSRGENLTPFSRSRIQLVGFGFWKRELEQPWFTYTEYYQNMNYPGDRRKPISRSGFSVTRQSLVEAGVMIERVLLEEEKQGMPANTRFLVSVTDKGVDALLDSITYRLTHDGETLSRLLPIRIADVVFEYPEFKSSVLEAVAGQPLLDEIARFRTGQD